jgi:LuxR family maltose regulon positive regulatory protein
MTDAAARDLIDPPWHAGAKYDPVRVNVELVQRDRLMAILDAGLSGRLAFVLAPAGFGKSTLLSQWRQSLQGRRIACAWVTLDEGDADPNQFLASLVIALSHAGIDIGELEIGARNSFAYSPVDLLLAKVVRLLADHGSRTVLILDDYHCVDHPEVNDMVSALARDPTIDGLIVINSRSSPRLDVATLIASGAALQIGPEHLRLNRDETSTILGVGSQPDFASDVYARTEGWPIAVQLARAQNGGMPHSPYQAAENERIFASYLADEVLAKLNPDERQFLLMVSALERFNADLADVVCGWHVSSRLVRELEKLAALIVPLDYDRQWYRLCQHRDKNGPGTGLKRGQLG